MPLVKAPNFAPQNAVKTLLGIVELGEAAEGSWFSEFASLRKDAEK